MDGPTPFGRAHFDHEFAKPDPWSFATSAYEQAKYRRQLDLVADRLEPEDVLELGCAEGVHTAMIARRWPKARVTGVDLSPVALARARERLPVGAATLVEADVLGFLAQAPTAAFDACVWSESIYYVGARVPLPRLLDAARDVARVLRPGGLLVMAHIVDQPEPPEDAITQRPLMEAYRGVFASVMTPVHHARYREAKAETGRTYGYEVWGLSRQ